MAFSNHLINDNWPAIRKRVVIGLVIFGVYAAGRLLTTGSVSGAIAWGYIFGSIPLGVLWAGRYDRSLSNLAVMFQPFGQPAVFGMKIVIGSVIGFVVAPTYIFRLISEQPWWQAQPPRWRRLLAVTTVWSLLVLVWA